MKLRNLQIYENCQLWYSLNYSNLFQVFANIFEKSEEHKIQKIFPKYVDAVTSTEWENNVFPKYVLKYLIYLGIFLFIIFVFMYIEVWCIITVFQTTYSV